MVKGDEIKQSAPPLGGSPATLKDVRERFKAFLEERCKGKEDPEKLQFTSSEVMNLRSHGHEPKNLRNQLMSDLFQNHLTRSGPVECLGQTFPSEDVRREHYLKRCLLKS